MCFDSKIGIDCWREVSNTLLATSYKEPPGIVKRVKKNEC